MSEDTPRRPRRRLATATITLAVLTLTATITAMQVALAPGTDRADSPGDAISVEEAGEDGEDAGSGEVCVNHADGVQLVHPGGWHQTGEDGGTPCRAFSPEPIAHDPLDTSPDNASVFLDALEVDFDGHVAETVDDPDRVHDKLVERADHRTDQGHRAVRYETVANGDGYYGEGTHVTSWVIEAGDRTVRLHTDDEAGPGAYDDNVAVLDAMAETVDTATLEV